MLRNIAGLLTVLALSYLQAAGILRPGDPFFNWCRAISGSTLRVVARSVGCCTRLRGVIRRFPRDRSERGNDRKTPCGFTGDQYEHHCPPASTIRESRCIEEAHVHESLRRKYEFACELLGKRRAIGEAKPEGQTLASSECSGAEHICGRETSQEGAVASAVNTFSDVALAPHS